MSFHREGIAAATFKGDARVNDTQRRAIERALTDDPEARILGLDQNVLPVLKGRFGYPPRMSKWSVKRNGDPGIPVIKPQMYEVWRELGSADTGQ